MRLKDENAFKLLFKCALLSFTSALLLACTHPSIQLSNNNSVQTDKNKTYGLVIHGGAGTITRENLTPEKERALRAKLSQAIEAGYNVIETGGSSLQAVTTSIVILENSPLFNAGRGAVFTADQTHELDASIMDGSNLNAGAVSSVRTVKNPILLAEKVMNNSRHVMLSGSGAEIFAAQQDLELVSNDYFSTDFRLQQLHKAQSSEKQHSSFSEPDLDYNNAEESDINAQDPFFKFGTVGVVAIDQNGNLAAGTSTGGMTNKRFGRVGDSPIIGAGTYADNRSCAVSTTGHGEFFIRYTVAHDVCARVLHGNKSLEQAATVVIMQDLVKVDGSGGIIAIDKLGNFVMSFNTAGMYRGYKFNKQKLETLIYKKE